MPQQASIRDLRNRFARIKELVEQEGEVLITDKGRPKYRIVLHSPVPDGVPQPIDYWARLNSYQPASLTAAEAQALHDENRGER
jgi:antitoxin (DNA-binding transcriptional repressor) of toxin-antitoxin stability system